MDCVVGEPAGEQAHPGKHRTDLADNHGVRLLESGDKRDVPSEVDHPLQMTHSAQGRDHHSQVPSNRGLQRKQGETAPLGIIENRSHTVTVSDDQSSEREIRLVQRDRRIVHHLAGHPGYSRKVGNQLIQPGTEHGTDNLYLLLRTDTSEVSPMDLPTRRPDTSR